MNAARIYGAVAFLLLLGIVVGGVALHFLENGTNISSESQGAVLDKQALLDGLASGSILYVMIEDYRVERIIPGIADLPKRVLVEMWLRPETGQHGALLFATQRDADGQLLQHTLSVDGSTTVTFPLSGESMAIKAHAPSAHGFVEEAWEWPRRLASEPDVEFKGAGLWNERATLIFCYSSHSAKSRYEFVEDAPLLRRFSDYRVDSDGRETLSGEWTVIDYRLLPADSSIPDLP